MACRQPSDTLQNNLLGRTANEGLASMHRGRMSYHAKAKVRTAVDWLEASAKTKYVYSIKTKKYHPWKLNFITLTLPTQGKTTDKEVKGILNAWLTMAKSKFGLRSYIWRAEAQMNGVIHFHITSDCYMWKTDLQNSWNNLLRRNKLLNGHANPPSTKVHSTYRVRNMAAYLTKYFTKGFKYKLIRTGKLSDWHVLAFRKKTKERIKIPYEKSKCERIIIGRLWGCSHTLSSIKPFKLTMEVPRAKEFLSWYRLQEYREFNNEYVNCFTLPKGFYDAIDDVGLKDWYNRTCLNVRKKRFFDQVEIYTGEGDMISDKKIL